MTEHDIAVPAEPLQAFDLFSIATADATAEMQAMHPATGVKVDIFITLRSSDNSRVKSKLRAHFKEVIAKERDKRSEDVLDHVDDNELDMLVAATVSWRSEAGGDGNIMFQGEWLKPTTENVRMVYAKVPALAEQARSFIAQRVNFMRG